MEVVSAVHVTLRLLRSHPCHPLSVGASAQRQGLGHTALFFPVVKCVLYEGVGSNFNTDFKRNSPYMIFSFLHEQIVSVSVLHETKRKAKGVVFLKSFSCPDLVFETIVAHCSV